LLLRGSGFSVEAPKFILERMDGKKLDVGRLIGKKTVVLNFWASWCSACEEEIPELKALMESPGADKAVFIGVNVGENEREAQRFIAKFKYPFPVLKDKNRKIAKKFGLIRLPTTVIIGKDGKIIYSGANPPKDLVLKQEPGH